MRSSWNSYFLEIAKQVATRSTCPRRHVGSVIVRDNVILSTGYNGSMVGTVHCDDAGCMEENGKCQRAVHSEANAIVQAAKNGVPLSNSVIYVTASPCWNCLKLIVNAGITKVYYLDKYEDSKVDSNRTFLPIEMIPL
jgi:dCMP deaminase